MSASRVEPKELELRFPIPAPAVSENQIRGKHWAVIAGRLEPWQMAARIAWGQLDRAEQEQIINVPCSVTVVIPFKRSGRRDPHNFTGTVVKAIIDVLVRHGAWPDDTADWVTVIDPVLIVGDEVIVRLTPRLGRDVAMGSRAVLRAVEPGNLAVCVYCTEKLKFAAWQARTTRQQVIANVYENGRWQRVEHSHPDCYTEAGEPHGKARA